MSMGMGGAHGYAYVGPQVCPSSDCNF
jgi:hypothetical protein